LEQIKNPDGIKIVFSSAMDVVTSARTPKYDNRNLKRALNIGIPFRRLSDSAYPRPGSFWSS